MSLFFQQPWLFPLLALAGLPLLVHLLSRTRPPVYRFSNLEFLQRVIRRTARFRRPQEFRLRITRTHLADVPPVRVMADLRHQPADVRLGLAKLPGFGQRDRANAGRANHEMRRDTSGFDARVGMGGGGEEERRSDGEGGEKKGAAHGRLLELSQELISSILSIHFSPNGQPLLRRCT